MNKPKVAILGVTGMLGSAVYDVFKDQYDLLVTYREADKLKLLWETYGQVDNCTAIQLDFAELYQDYLEGFQGKLFGPRTQAALDQLQDCDWVINAVGVIKPHSLKDPVMTMFINGTLPHILAAAFGTKLIHITTDCVYDGTAGAPYDETSPKRPVDLYGISKLIGEPTSALVLRTSIIGLELGNSAGGLLGWFLSQAGGSTKGFTNHLWNGITTREFAKVCAKIINGQVTPPPAGIYHIFSNPVDKYAMQIKFNSHFQTNITIEPVTAPVEVDRRLATIQDFNRQLQIASFDQMIDDIPWQVSVS